MVLVALICFELFVGLFQAYGVRPANYLISPKASALLHEDYGLYGSQLIFDKATSSYEYNKDYRPSSEVAGQSYRPKFSASFKADPGGGYTVVDVVNNVSVSFVPKFKTAEPQKQSSRLVYPIRGTSAQKVLTPGASAVKEDIILNEFEKDSMSFSYDIQLDSSMEARLDSGGGIGIYGVNSALLGNVTTGTDKDAQLLQKARQGGKKDNLLFGIPAPFIVQANKQPSAAKAWYTLKGNTLTVHTSGLKKATFPLSIDPSVVITTATDFMRGNNETNVDFDVSNELIQKGKTTGAWFNAWTSTMDLNAARWNHGTAVAGGFVYAVGGISGQNVINRTYSTAGTSTFSVPSGVSSIIVKMWGGGGGGGGGGSASIGGDGGGGGFSQATLSVTALETLDVFVGGAGGAGTGRSDSGDGGGGGGHSEIERSGTSLIIAAGGGGAGGGDNNGAGTPGGSGGAGGDTTSGVAGGSSGSAGGGGGGGSGSGGTAGSGGGNPGTAGSAETGGAGADGRSAAGADGGANNGGTHNGDGDGGTGSASNNYAGGGGGGGGRYGGGGGSGSANNNAGGGGGGGGSSYTTGTSTSSSAGSGSTPGNSSDTDRGTAGQGGTGGATTSAGTAGTDGLIVISYIVGSATNTVQSTVYWAKFSTANSTITNATPGFGTTCSSWCTNSAYDLPSARAGFSLVAYNGFLYVIGGVNSAGSRQNTVYIAKLGANGEPSLWHPTGGTAVYWYTDNSFNLSSVRSYSAAIAYNNNLYLLGGQSDGGSNPGGVTTSEYVNIKPTGELGTWTSTTALPSVRHSHSVQVYNDYLYLIGGNSNGTLQSSVNYIKINSDGSLASSWNSTNGFSGARMSWGGSMTTVWGAYIYLSGGCSAVNGSGYCTTVSSDTQIASINSDGSIDKWTTISGVSSSRMSYGLVAWRNVLYAIGGCTAQDGSSGDCTDVNYEADYGAINQDGNIGLGTVTTANGSGTCTGGSPTNCNLPSGVGNVLNAVVLLNGYLYVIGGCTNNACGTVSQGVAYTAISSDGTITSPTTCGSWTVSDSYCVNSTSLTTALASAGVTVFGGAIYLVGGWPNITTISYASPNNDGSISRWNSIDTTNAGATDVSYAFAYARANPSSASTNPGNLYIFGGCTTITSVSCTGMTGNVYKCNISTAGVPSGCSTSGQQGIGTITGASGAGLGAMAGTVYANYIYLMGGLAPSVNDSDTVRYAKFDNSNNVVAVTGSAWVESGNHVSIGRRRGSAFGYNGYLYFMGGYNGTSLEVLDDIDFAKIDVSDGSISAFTSTAINVGPRWGASIALTNGKAYVVGGCSAGQSPTGCNTRESSISPFILYNNDYGGPAAYSTSANAFSTDRMGAGSTIYNGYIYVAGGCTSTTDCSTLTNSTQYAAIDSNTGAVGSWSAGGNLPASVGWGKLFNAGGTLYYVGGQTGAATTTAVSTVYYTSGISSGNPTWNGSAASGGVGDTSGQAAQPRTQFGAAIWNNRIYVVGGYSSGGTVQSTVYYTPSLSGGGNIAADSWGSTTAFNVARAGTTAVAYANNLYLLGGDDGTNILNDVQYTQINSDATVDSWTYTTSLPTATTQADGFAVNGYIYLFGGRSSIGTCMNKTVVAPISANTTIATGNNPTGVGEWFETNEKFSGARYGNAVAYYNGKAYITGGGCKYFPTFDSVTSTQNNSESGTNNVLMPPVVESGDLLMVLFTNDGSSTVTTPSGWTLVGGAPGTVPNGTNVRAGVYIKVAAGTEDGTNVNFQTSASEKSSAQVFRILAANWDGTTSGVESTGASAGSTASPNPASLNPAGWGTEKTAWVAYAAGSTYTEVQAYPSGFLGGNHINTSTTDTSGASTSSAYYESVNAASQDPGAFTMSAAQQGVAFTVAIRGPSTDMSLITGSSKVVQTALLTQPQLVKYSRMIDTDTDVTPNAYLANGLDNGIGASWTLKYRSMTNPLITNPTYACVYPVMTGWGQETDAGNINLGQVGTYTPKDSSGSSTGCARFFYLSVDIDASRTFGYPEDVTRGPTMTDLTLFFTADPSKRLRHGKTFTGGILQPLNTPPL